MTSIKYIENIEYAAMAIISKDIIKRNKKAPSNCFPLEKLAALGVDQMKKLLFVCVENAGRSQIAEAFARKYGNEKFIISSAGNKPADKVNPFVVQAMLKASIFLKISPKYLRFKYLKSQT